MRDWNLKFKCLSDPTHILRNYLAQEDLITIAVSGGENATDSRFYQVHPKIKYYKNGVAQPAVLCVKSDRKVLYQWAVVPQLTNVGGASDRPVPAEIWSLVQIRLSDPAYTGEAQLNTRGALSACVVA
eukprot:Em0023g89a